MSTSAMTSAPRPMLKPSKASPTILRRSDKVYDKLTQIHGVKNKYKTTKELWAALNSLIKLYDMKNDDKYFNVYSDIVYQDNKAFKRGSTIEYSVLEKLYKNAVTAVNKN